MCSKSLILICNFFLFVGLALPVSSALAADDRKVESQDRPSFDGARLRAINQMRNAVQQEFLLEPSYKPDNHYPKQ